MSGGDNRGGACLSHAPVAERARPASQAVRAGLLLQRKCDCGTHTPDGGECPECERERLQRKHRHGEDEQFQIPPSVHAVLGRSGRPLDGGTRGLMEKQFGQDFSRVRVHTDGPAAQSARAVRALAYTVGRNVVFGAGQYAPHTPVGRRLLAHELAHVVQQRGTSGSPGTRGYSDAGLERAADHAADRVAAGSQASALPAAPRPMLARQAVPAESSSSTSATVCQLTGPAPAAPPAGSSAGAIGPDRRRVTLPDGRRFVVTRIPWVERDAVIRPSANINWHDVWVEIDYCLGQNEARVRLSADVPDQAIQLLRNAIASGGDLNAAWSRASVTPTLGVHLRHGSFSIDLQGDVTLGSSGDVRGGGASATVHLPPASLGGVQVQPWLRGGIHTPPTGSGIPDVRVMGGVRGTFGSSPPPRPCYKVRAGYHFECQQEHVTPPRQLPGQQRVTDVDERSYNLFFHFTTAKFDDARNRHALAALQHDLAGGFQVTGIDGWTSPEGPMGHGTGNFEGNIALSGERAEAARRRIAEKLCPRGADCFAPGAGIRGHGERMDPQDPTTGAPQDIRGAPLESHVADTFPTDPGEASVRSSRLMERLRRTPSLHRRAELIYPWLRRAVVHLRRSRTHPEACTVPVPGTTITGAATRCPQEAVRAAFPHTPGHH